MDGVVALLLALAFVKLWSKMRGHGTLLPKCFGQQRWGEGAADAAGAQELRGWGGPLVPTPLATLLQPGRLDRLLHGSFATPAERRAVGEAAPEAPPTLANYLAWRRAFAGALLLLGAVSYVLQCCVLFSTWRHHLYFESVGRDPQMETYKAWVAGNPADPGFVEYSKEKALALLAGVLGEVLRGAFFLDLAVCALEVAPLLMLLLAMGQWTSFASSRRWVLRAWFAFFVSAFVVSLIPVRLMLSFSGAERQADYYVHELAVAMNLDKAQQVLLGGCAEIGAARFAERVEVAGDTLRKTCMSLSRFPLQLAMPCIDSLSLCHVDLGKALDGCREAVQQFDMGHVEKATSILQQECLRIKEAFTAPGSPQERKEGRSRAFEVLVDMMRMPFHAVVPSVEAVSLTVSALHATLSVLPPALGIAPGLMAAGFATKVLAPHSELPGAVIIIVPIIQTSFGWLAHTVLFQYVSHPWLLTLLVVVVTYPLVYIWIGGRYRVTMPVHQGTLHNAAQASTVATGVLGILAAALLCRIVQDVGAGHAQVFGFSQLVEWCHVSWTRLAVACVVRTFYAFALTFFGASDWMISDISMQLRYWRHCGLRGSSRHPALGDAEEGEEEEEEEDADSLGAPQHPGDGVLAMRRLGTLPLLSGESSDEEEITEARQNEDLSDLLRHRLLCKVVAAARRPAVASLCSDGSEGGEADGHTPLKGTTALALFAGLQALALASRACRSPARRPGPGGSEATSGDGIAETP